MLAIDTNLIVRYLVRDDAGQAAKARKLVDENDVLVSSTVLLECERVLRSAYDFPPERCAKALADFVGLPRVTVDEPVTVGRALDWAARGLDFADALHLSKAEGCESFVSFDRSLLKTAKALGLAVRSP